MKSLKNSKVLAGQLALVLMALAACTKETPYQGQFKPDTLSKAQVNTDSEFLYVESYASVSRSATDAIPFYMGDEQLVKFRFTKDSLEVVAQEKDARFAKNSQNNKVILSIPVEHKSYRCETDRFGECKNREEENKDIPELSKDLFKPDFSKMSEVSASVLPADLQKYFNGCYVEKAQKVVDYEFTDDAVNLKIEKTFQLGPECAGGGDDLRDGSVIAIVYHHSFIKLNKFASPDYKAVDYPSADESTFGFFKTERTKLDADNNDLEKNTDIFMNRWNPNRSEVVYYLSDEFDKPENVAFKQAAHLTFDKVNEGLVKSGAKFRLILKDPAQKAPGDIRNSMIVLVEDPSGAGLLGYGPAASNPYTGEILSARVVMFSGILKTGLSRTYEEIRLARLDAKNAAAAAPTAVSTTVASPLANTSALKRLLSPKASSPSPALVAPTVSSADAALSDRDLKNLSKSLHNYKSNRDDGSFLPGFADKSGKDATADAESDLRFRSGRLAAMSKHCTYPLEYVNFDATVLKGIESQFPGEMKAWDELKDDEKNKAINTLSPPIFEMVLIHELGHNLGLRHNFQGSEDKANWYKANEIPGLARPIPYSSVMDYGYSQTNQLPVLGKYDIAALRFGYTRQVEVRRDGSTDENPAFDLKSVDTTITAMTKADPKLNLKEYGYCTDENVSGAPGCKRFDSGTTFSEIAAHWIRIYNQNYNARNFRNGRRDFSLRSDREYASARFEAFLNMRFIYEAYESLANRFPPTHKAWQQDNFIDIKNAALLTGQFFIDIVKMPDTTCVIAKDNDASEARTFQALSDISPQLLTCFDKRIKAPAGFSIVGQLGRSFQSKKSMDSTNAFADQIDARGIWIDKLIALRLLLTREFGSITLDRYVQNYTEVAELRQPIRQMIAELLLDTVTNKVEIVSPTGAKSLETLSYDLSRSQVIHQPLMASLNRVLDLRGGEVPFNEQMMSMLVKYEPSVQMRASAQDFLRSFIVYKMSILDATPVNVTEREGISEEIDGNRFMALPENDIAFSILELRRAARLLAVLDDAGKKLIVKMASEKSTTLPQETPADQLPALQAALTIRPDLVGAFASGEMKSQQYYDLLITQLPARSAR